MYFRARFGDVGSCCKGVEVAEMGNWRTHSTDAGAAFLHDLVLEFEDLSVALAGSWADFRIDRTVSAADDCMLSSPSSAWIRQSFPPPRAGDHGGTRTMER